ncbi:MAG TPA: hypothetical protein VN132_01525, partial [Bdellovibrio sp.]|nr:hypothetical protein [Bdellovibrio sp.]
MLTLIVRQSLKNGTAKTWKLRSTNATQTFGSSRLADVISISPETKGIQGVFEFRDQQWWFLNMDMAVGAEAQGSPTLCLNKEQSLELSDCTLHFTPVKKEADLYLRLEKTNFDNAELGKQFQLYVVKQGPVVLQTKILPINKKFKPAFCDVTVDSITSPEWHRQTVGALEVSQRTLSLEDASRLARFSPGQMVDEDSKKGVILMLGAAAFFLTMAIFAPKGHNLMADVVPPKVAQKILVKTEIKPKRKVEAAAAPAPVAAPKQVVVQPPKATPSVPTPHPEKNTGSGGKLANMMKSISNGRIS